MLKNIQNMYEYSALNPARAVLNMKLTEQKSLRRDHFQTDLSCIMTVARLPYRIAQLKGHDTSNLD
jgi:hypothetical protein